MSAFIPPWAHDGGDGQADRAAQGSGDPRADPAGHADARRRSWDNEWQEIPGPRGGADRRGAEPGARAAPGQDAGRGRGARGTRTRSTPCSTCSSRTTAFTYVAVFGMSEPDVTLALKQPWVSIDNDSQGTAPDGLLGKEHPHPRAYGTFPRILRKYVREEQLLTLEDAIRKFSSLPAQRMRLGRPRRAQGRHVGRRRGLRPGPRFATWRRSTSRTSSRRGCGRCW